jgi:excisionase family DNA binding protein
MAATQSLPQLLTITETEDCLRVSNPTLYRLLADGELQSLKIRGRRLILRDSIDGYIERHRSKP